MRTLVVSDLHLGSRQDADVLRRHDAALGALRDAIADCQRLVLLGDVIELRQRPLPDALTAALPVLSALGHALPGEAEVIVVPGNHDHHLLTAWRDRLLGAGTPVRLGLETAVDWVAGEALSTVARALGGDDRVRAAYPGVWLRDDVYAIHGHYGDRHTTVPMLERLGAGAMARIAGEPSDGPHSPDDYETVLAPIYAWIHELAQHDGPRLRRSSQGTSARAWQTLAGSSGRRSLRRRALTALFPALVLGLSRTGLGPLHADLSGPELRRAALLAAGESLQRLNVSAPFVIFGHTHRAGPLDRDDRSEWRTDGGASLINSGCWVYERAFLGDEPSRSPYRPGFVVRLDDDGPPALVNLLDTA
ncbi:MAG TPA: metallophosphoesterase [Solirubrobacteraceae bacterium]